MHRGQQRNAEAEIGERRVGDSQQQAGKQGRIDLPRGGALALAALAECQSCTPVAIPMVARMNGSSRICVSA